MSATVASSWVYDAPLWYWVSHFDLKKFLFWCKQLLYVRLVHTVVLVNIRKQSVFQLSLGKLLHQKYCKKEYRLLILVNIRWLQSDLQLVVRLKLLYEILWKLYIVEPSVWTFILLVWSFLTIFTLFDDFQESQLVLNWLRLFAGLFLSLEFLYLSFCEKQWKFLGFHVFTPSFSEGWLMNFYKNVASFFQLARGTQFNVGIRWEQKTLIMEVKVALFTYDKRSSWILQRPFTDALNKKQWIDLILKIFIIESDMLLILRFIFNRVFYQMLSRDRIDSFHMLMRVYFLLMVHFAGFNIWERVIILVWNGHFTVVHWKTWGVLDVLIIIGPDWIDVLRVVLNLWEYGFGVLRIAYAWERVRIVLWKGLWHVISWLMWTFVPEFGQHARAWRKLDLSILRSCQLLVHSGCFEGFE